MTKNDPGEASTEQVEQTDDGIRVTFTGEYGTISGWSDVRENLGLNPAGPDQVDGVELVEEDGVYYDEDDDYPHGYERAVLLFDDVEALERASDRLFSKATEMFEYGLGRDAEKVQAFASRIPSKYTVEQSLQTDTDHGGDADA